MNNYKAKIDREDLVDAITGAVNNAILNGKLESYEEIRGIMEAILINYDVED